MALFLQNQQRKSNALDAASRFRFKHSKDDIRTLFKDRRADDEFAEIGRIALGHKDVKHIDRHIFVWTGYEVVTHSPYLIL